MGVCLSCLGVGNSADTESYTQARRGSERTPLLQDPTSILQHPDPQSNNVEAGEDQQLDQAALQAIVDRTAENLIDIQSAFKQETEGESIKYLIDRLQSNGPTTTTTMSTSEMMDRDLDSSRQNEGMLNLEKVTTTCGTVTDEERQFLNDSCDLLTQSLERVKMKKPVGEVVVKLS